MQINKAQISYRGPVAHVATSLVRGFGMTKNLCRAFSV